MIAEMLTAEDKNLIRGLINAKIRELQALAMSDTPDQFRIQARNAVIMEQNLQGLKERLGL